MLSWVLKFSMMHLSFWNLRMELQQVQVGLKMLQCPCLWKIETKLHSMSMLSKIGLCRCHSLKPQQSMPWLLLEPPIAPDEPAVDDVVAGPDEITIDGTRIDISHFPTCCVEGSLHSFGCFCKWFSSSAFQALGAALTTSGTFGITFSEAQFVQRVAAPCESAWNPCRAN